MEEEQLSARRELRVEIKYGLITFLGVLLWYVVMHFLPFGNPADNLNSAFGFSPIFVPALCIYLGIRERKNKVLEGDIDFGRAFATGLIITFFYATLIMFALAAAWPWLELQATDALIESERIRLTEEGRPEAEVEELIRQIKGVTSLPMQLMQTFMSNLIIGMLFSLVIAFGFKRPEYPE